MVRADGPVEQHRAAERPPLELGGTDETAMDFRRLLPEIRWQPRLSPVSPGFSREVCPPTSVDWEHGAQASGFGVAASLSGSWRDGRRYRTRRTREQRSEEHTSELQSPCNLVCRLLL